MWEIYKFGGTSITKTGFDLIKHIIETRDTKNIVIVLSAMNTVTNRLISLTENYCEEKYQAITNKYSNLAKNLGLNQFKLTILVNEYSKLKHLFLNSGDNNLKIAYGEILSTLILSLYIDYPVIDSRLIIKKLNNGFICDLDIFFKYTGELKVIIMQGFIASDKEGKTVLLSRGGSDTTATLIGNALDSKKVFIYTDVDGVLSSDPRLVKNAKLINTINYNIAQELASCGANILHPYSIQLAKDKNIELHVKNTYNSGSEGTIINNKLSKDMVITNESMVTIFHIKTVNMWNNYGFIYDIFKDFADLGVIVTIITTSQFVVSCTTQCNNIEILEKLKSKLLTKYEVQMIIDSNIISVVGNSIAFDTLFQIVKRYHIHITHFSSSNLSISFIVEKDIYKLLMNDIHDIMVTN